MASFITKADINAEVRNYLEIQEEAKTKVFNPHGGGLSGKAKQFYVNAKEISFIFEKDLIISLLNNPGAEYIRIYYGAIPGPTASPRKTDGTPTLVLVPAKFNQTTGKVENITTNVYSTGIEWPEGISTSGTSTNFDIGAE
jgi:hypothetical protein